MRHGQPRGLNAARNTGLRESGAPLVAFVDDDVLAPPGLARRAGRGRARATRRPRRSAGRSARASRAAAPRGCGREEPPITTLDLGPEDREAEMVWGANFAVRRSAVERIGPFDERIVRPHGDEEEWLERLRAAGRPDRLPGRGGARPPPHRRGRPPARAGARRLRARAGARGPATGAAARAPGARRRAARAGRLRLAHGAARLPAGPDHGRPLGRPGGGGAAPAAGARGQAAVSHDFLSGDAGDVTPPLAPAQARRWASWPLTRSTGAALTGRADGPPGRRAGAAAGAGGGRVPARLAAAGGARARCAPSATRCGSPSARWASRSRRWRRTRCCRSSRAGSSRT